MIIKRKKISVVLIVVLIGGIMVGCGQSNVKKEGPVQMKMEKYIKDAYKEDFVVELPIKHSDESGISNYDYAVAYPKKDKSLKFEIDYRGGKFSDNYMDVKWSREGKPIVGNRLREVYGENTKYDFELTEEINENTKKMNYKEVVENCPDKGAMRLVYYVFLDGLLDKQKEGQKAYDVLKTTILDNKIKEYLFTVFFVDRKYKDLIMNNKIDYEMLDNDNLYKSKKLLNGIYSTELSNIKNKDDLIKRFRY